MTFLRKLDPKLVTTFVTLVIVRLAVGKLGVAEGDELLQSGIALVPALIAGYFKANDGTLLRQPPEDGEGNASPPGEQH